MTEQRLLAIKATQHFDQLDAEFKQILECLTAQEKIETVLHPTSITNAQDALDAFRADPFLALFCCAATSYVMAQVLTAEMQAVSGVSGG